MAVFSRGAGRGFLFDDHVVQIAGVSSFPREISARLRRKKEGKIKYARARAREREGCNGEREKVAVSCVRGHELLQGVRSKRRTPSVMVIVTSWMTMMTDVFKRFPSLYDTQRKIPLYRGCESLRISLRSFTRSFAMFHCVIELSWLTSRRLISLFTVA